MAFSSTADPTPDEYFPGYVLAESESDGSVLAGVLANSDDYICIPCNSDDSDLITTQGGLTNAEANLTTGNGSKVVYALLKLAYYQLQLASAANRPESVTVSESSISGASASTYRQSLTLQALFGSVSADIVAES
mgnify:CR=1 FL=1